MTARLGNIATSKVIERITGPKGVNNSLARLSLGDEPLVFDLTQVRPQNAAAELVERAIPMQYPAASVSCEKIVNSLIEKFRTFSGAVHMSIELRHSQDRLESVQDGLETYVDAVLDALNQTRGDWGDGLFYAGAYQVTFGPVKHGGRNFLQSAKITLELGASRD